MSQARTQMHPRDTRWLGRAASLSVIAAKLEQLGHDPDYVSPDALAELVRRAAGSEQSLRGGLAGALFLASTDDAPCVERIHVERAFPEEAAAALPPGGRHRARWLLPCAAAALAGSIVLFHRMPEHTMPRAPETHTVPVHPAFPRTLAMLPVPAPKLQPPPLMALPHTDPAPLPRAAAQGPLSSQIAIALPVGPQALVRLMTGPHADPASLIARLRRAGIAPMSQRNDLGASGGDQVLYYFIEDSALAEHIARLAAEAGTTPLPQPRLVQPYGRTPIPPGSIDILLQ